MKTYFQTNSISTKRQMKNISFSSDIRLLKSYESKKINTNNKCNTMLAVMHRYDNFYYIILSYDPKIQII